VHVAAVDRLERGAGEPGDDDTAGYERERRRAREERQRLDVGLRARGDGSDQAGRAGRARDIAGPTFKPDHVVELRGEMRRV